MSRVMRRHAVPWQAVDVSARSAEFSPGSSFTACVHDVAIGNVDMCWANFWPTSARRQMASFTVTCVFLASNPPLAPLSRLSTPRLLSQSPHGACFPSPPTYNALYSCHLLADQQGAIYHDQFFCIVRRQLRELSFHEALLQPFKPFSPGLW